MTTSTTQLPNQISRTNSGFTLIELMVTIAVLAIIVGIAAPSLGTQLANQRVKSAVSIIESALIEAKSESIILRQNVSVIYDSTAKTITVQNAKNVILSTYTLNNRSTLTVTINPTTVNKVTFQPNKIVAGGAEVTYTVCDNGSNYETPKQVRLNKIANINTTNTGSC